MRAAIVAHKWAHARLEAKGRGAGKTSEREPIYTCHSMTRSFPNMVHWAARSTRRA